MATAIPAEILEILQQSTRRISESRSHILKERIYLECKTNFSYNSRQETLRRPAQ
jgi:hypothetical protein